MRTLFCLVLATSTALAACGAGNVESTDSSVGLRTTSATLTTHTAVNPNASFDHYVSFSFGGTEGAPAGFQMTPRSAAVQSRLRPLIAAALKQKGYNEVPDRGDIVITFGSGRREESIHQSSGMDAEWMPDDENADFVEGALVIDAFDGKKGTRVWHGASHGEINPDQIDDKRLHKSVDELISKFPQQTILPNH
jgi:hypothetical protein